MKTLLLILTLSFAAFGQTQTAQPAKPKTELESFQEKYGVVVVKTFSDVSEMTGSGGVLKIQARALKNPSAGSKVRGLVVEIDSTEKYASSARSFIEYDEIDSLIKGIAYISKIDKSVTTLESFEAEYKTKGDFSITVFSNRQGGVRAALSVGSYSQKNVFIKLEDLAVLITNLEKAKNVLDADR